MTFSQKGTFIHVITFGSGELFGTRFDHGRRRRRRPCHRLTLEIFYSFSPKPLDQYQDDTVSILTSVLPKINIVFGFIFNHCSDT